MNAQSNQIIPGCSHAELSFVKEVLINTFGESSSFYLFGSRVTGTHKSSSDLDVLIDSDIPISLELFTYAKEAFEDSHLTFKVDLLDKANLASGFIERITPDLIIV